MKDGGGAKIEVVHTVSVRGGGVKRDVKFAGFEEDYEDSSDDDENDQKERDMDEGEENEDEIEIESESEEEGGRGGRGGRRV